jgi:predicted nucleic acid-binding protein
MTSTAIRTHCLDASALVKHYINEDGSAELHDYLQGQAQANWYTTPFCLFEALGVLKRKYKSKRKSDTITQDEYHTAGHAMLAEYAARSKNLPDSTDIVDPLVFSQVKSLCQKYPKLDFSDAFQIVSVQEKSRLRWGGSIPMLITADKYLGRAAEQEGLQVKVLGRRGS